jgi:hypothetical protein
MRRCQRVPIRESSHMHASCVKPRFIRFRRKSEKEALEARVVRTLDYKERGTRNLIVKLIQRRNETDD